MDPAPPAHAVPVHEDDEWDTDGFVIPSLEIEESQETAQAERSAPAVEAPAATSPKQPKKEENIYLGPHGAPPSQSKQQVPASSNNRKQKFKQKLKEADKRTGGTGRENKLENLRELVGSGGKSSPTMSKGSNREWLDPHCHESQFEKWQ